MANKRIRKKLSKKHGYCAKCGGHDTVAFGPIMKKGSNYYTIYTDVMCLRCDPEVKDELKKMEEHDTYMKKFDD